MIESISGTVIEKSPTFCVLNCHGLGIGLHISINTFQKLQDMSADQVFLYTHLYVREDALQLYGFSEAKEREFFRMLIAVSGIGPRMALAVLSGLNIDELEVAISQNDVDTLTRIPGVGRKTAQRLILELREKIATRADLQTVPGAGMAGGMDREKMNEAILALVTLGYRQIEAKKAIERLMAQNGSRLSLEELIKEALKEIR